MMLQSGWFPTWLVELTAAHCSVFLDKGLMPFRSRRYDRCKILLLCIISQLFIVAYLCFYFIDIQKHTSMTISSIFSADMIARWKDFTIANVWLKPCFTTNDDIRLGSVNEAPKFYFLSTYTLKVYCHNSKVGGMGLDWLYVLGW